MSLYMNSDYEVVSNAEVAGIIEKYSTDMLYLTLQEILTQKGLCRSTPLANMVYSYELNAKNDMQRFEFMQNDIMERRTELYNAILDKICSFHNLSWNMQAGTDIYTLAYTAYWFLVSGFYNSCVKFHTAWLYRESSAIVKLLDQAGVNTVHQYAKKRYTGKLAEVAVIHTNLNEVLDIMQGIDVSLEDIINVIYGNNNMIGEMLKSSLVDNGDFYKNFYVTAAGGINRAEIVTDIRFGLMPNTQSEISDYVSEE